MLKMEEPSSLKSHNLRCEKYRKILLAFSMFTVIVLLSGLVLWMFVYPLGYINFEKMFGCTGRHELRGYIVIYAALLAPDVSILLLVPLRIQQKTKFYSGFSRFAAELISIILLLLVVLPVGYLSFVKNPFQPIMVAVWLLSAAVNTTFVTAAEVKPDFGNWLMTLNAFDWIFPSRETCSEKNRENLGKLLAFLFTVSLIMFILGGIYCSQVLHANEF